MPRRAPRHVNGRRPRLTAELAKDIVALVEAGNYVETAAKAHGIGRSTMWEWLQKGAEATRALAAGEHLPERARGYADFADALTRARARAEVNAIEVVRRVMQGGHLIEETPLVTRDGRLVRDESGQILYSRRYAQPDGRLALEYAARSAPERWGRAATGCLDIPSHDAEPVRADATDVIESLVTRLAAIRDQRRQETFRVIHSAPEYAHARRVLTLVRA